MANYLYNGVKLPALPEWDRAVYPYAVIGYDGSLCGLYFSTSPIVFTNKEVASDVYTTLYCFKDAGNHFFYWNPNGPWENYWEGVSIVPSHKAGAMTELNVFWTNHDILNDDGSVNLAASDPIPVGTAPNLDPLSLWLGWKAGNWVARQRGKAKKTGTAV